MIGEYLTLRLDLVVNTPLHIGSGEDEASANAVSGEEKAPSVQSVLRDCADNPYIPGSTLKGVLRRALENEEIGFGTKTVTSGESARSGRILFMPAFLKNTEHEGQSQSSDCIFEETGIAKDPDTGVVENAKLFQRQMVRPGTVFALRLKVLKNDTAAQDTVARCLAILSREEGQSLGKSTRQGTGRVHAVRSTLSIEDEHVNPSDVEAWKAKISAAAAETKHDTSDRITLRLTCDGPFLIHDPSRYRTAGDKETPALQALLDFDGQGPRLTGSTLLGALRARFDIWHRAQLDEEVQPGDLPPTATERLFGTSDWKGRVSIDALQVRGKSQSKPITSIKLDRFSGAPIDNMLFTTEGWLGFEAKVTLSLIRRGGARLDTVFDADDDAFRRFVQELCDPIWGGLHLGHGVNKGFGWFEVQHG